MKDWHHEDKHRFKISGIELELQISDICAIMTLQR